MSIFFLCFAAWTALALAMDRHHDDAFGTNGTPPGRATLPGLKNPLAHPPYLRRAGWAMLLLSLWLATSPAESAPGAMPASVSVVAWVVALSVSAISVTAMVTWQPRRAPALAMAALVAGLLAQALGW